MKVLKIIGILVGALLVIFFLIGILYPTFDYGNTVTINAPKNAVWTLYTTRKKDWVDGFKSQTLVSGTDFTNTAEYQTIIVSGEEMVMHEKITDIHPEDKIVWALDNDVLISSYTYEFKGDAIQTEVSTHYTIEGKNTFMKSVLYISKGYLKNSDAAMLAALKQLAENEK